MAELKRYLIERGEPWPLTRTQATPSGGVHLSFEDDFAGMNEKWMRWFPSDPPARQGAKPPARIPGLKVSIAAIAAA